MSVGRTRNWCIATFERTMEPEDYAVIDELLAPNWDVEEQKTMVAAMHAAFGNLRLTMDQLIAEDDQGRRPLGGNWDPSGRVDGINPPGNKSGFAEWPSFESPTARSSRRGIWQHARGSAGQVVARRSADHLMQASTPHGTAGVRLSARTCPVHCKPKLRSKPQAVHRAACTATCPTAGARNLSQLVIRQVMRDDIRQLDRSVEACRHPPLAWRAANSNGRVRHDVQAHPPPGAAVTALLIATLTRAPRTRASTHLQ